MNRLKWKFLIINVWMIFLGALMGWSVPGFPWGVLIAAVGTTIVGAVILRRSGA